MIRSSYYGLGAYDAFLKYAAAPPEARKWADKLHKSLDGHAKPLSDKELEDMFPEGWEKEHPHPGERIRSSEWFKRGAGSRGSVGGPQNNKKEPEPARPKRPSSWQDWDWADPQQNAPPKSSTNAPPKSSTNAPPKANPQSDAYAQYEEAKKRREAYDAAAKQRQAEYDERYNQRQAEYKRKTEEMRRTSERAAEEDARRAAEEEMAHNKRVAIATLIAGGTIAGGALGYNAWQKYRKKRKR